MANEEITISELELADEVLADMVLAVDTTTDTRAVTLRQLKAWLGSSLPTGFIVPAVGKISDERFTLLDGKTLARTGTYEAFCNKVIEKVQAGNWTAVTEAQYNQELAQTGQCGKFVITNDYVRIPKLGNSLYSAEISGLCGVKGNGKTLGLTDGTYTNGVTSSPLGYGLFATGQIGNVGETVPTDQPMSTGKLTGVTTDKTKSGIEAEIEDLNGEIFVYWYMVISTNGQTEQIDVDINEVYEDLELKANKDLSNVANVSSTFKETSVGWGMPDYSAGIAISSFPYTAPTKGFVDAILTNATSTITVNGSVVGSGYSNTAYTSTANILVDGGDVVSMGTVNQAYFYPLKGVN